MLAILAAPLAAQVPGNVDGAGSERRLSGYLAAGFGIARAAEESYTWSWTVPVNEGGGRSQSRTTYHLPEGEAYSIGGGAFYGAWGVGLLASEQSHSQSAESFEFFSTAALPGGFEGRALTEFELVRRERAVHLQAMWKAPLIERYQAVLFAGPSYFYEVSQETLDFVGIQLVEPGVLRPQPFPAHTQVESAWGYHLGGDFAVFLTSRFGVGISALYSHGTVELRDRYAEEMLTNRDVVIREQDVGGVQVAIGVRVRL